MKLSKTSLRSGYNYEAGNNKKEKEEGLAMYWRTSLHLLPSSFSFFFSFFLLLLSWSGARRRTRQNAKKLNCTCTKIGAPEMPDERKEPNTWAIGSFLSSGDNCYVKVESSKQKQHIYFLLSNPITLNYDWTD